MISLIPEETLVRLRDRFGGQLDSLAPAEVQALATAEIEGAVSNARLQELLADHPVEITRMLARLCDNGMLVSDNRRRWTTYRLGAVGPAPSLFDGGNSSHLPADSSHLPANSSHLVATAPHDRAEVEVLRAIARQVAESGKVSASAMRDAILQLCTDRFLTTEELAGLLNRTPENLRSRHLTPMVAEGVLRLRYPEATNRPDQAYTRAAGE